MSRNLNQRPSPTLAIAVIALFLALGGGALATTSFIGSDGQIHACVGKKGQLTVSKPPGKCGKGQRAIAWNQRGRRGIKGIRGVRGIQGANAMSFDKQFPLNDNKIVAVINGVQVRALCNPAASPPSVVLIIQRTDVNHNLFAWGTKGQDGVLTRLDAFTDNAGSPGDDVLAHGTNTAELDVVAGATAPGEPVKWNRFDLSLVQGSACNFHGLIIPGGAAG